MSNSANAARARSLRTRVSFSRIVRVAASCALCTTKSVRVDPLKDAAYSRRRFRSGEIRASRRANLADLVTDMGSSLKQS